MNTAMDAMGIFGFCEKVGFNALTANGLFTVFARDAFT